MTTNTHTSEWESIVPSDDTLLDSHASDPNQLKDLQMDQDVEKAWVEATRYATAAAAQRGKKVTNKMIARTLLAQHGVSAMDLAFVTESAEQVTAANTADTVVANVQELARKCFGPEVSFDPQNGIALISGEPVLYVLLPSAYSMQRLMYFSAALDRDVPKYKVSYVMPDRDHGRNSIKVCFFRGFQPSTRDV